MSNDLEEESELQALRDELLKGLNKKSKPSEKTSPENFLEPKVLKEDDELEELRLQALKAKKDSKKYPEEKTQIEKKRELPARFRYDRDSEDEEDYLDLGDYNNTKHDESDQENENNNVDGDSKKDNFLDKYQKYRERCTRIMSNEAYEPGLLSSNLKETLNNLDLKRLLNEKIDECNSSKTDLILEKLDYAYRPITEPISIKKNEIYINKNFKQKIDYQRNNSRNGETKYWKNNNYYYRNEKSYNDKIDPINNHQDEYDDNEDDDDDDDDDEIKSNKKLKSIVVQQVINTTKRRDDLNRSSKNYHSSYKRRRRYDSSSSR